MERRERLGLPTALVEREHHVGPQPLAQRVSPDEGLDLRHQLGIGAAIEIGGDPLLEYAEPKVFEALDVRLRERLRLEVGEG